jgi:hypothetical protein
MGTSDFLQPHSRVSVKTVDPLRTVLGAASPENESSPKQGSTMTVANLKQVVRNAIETGRTPGGSRSITAEEASEILRANNFFLPESRDVYEQIMRQGRTQEPPGGLPSDEFVLPSDVRQTFDGVFGVRAISSAAPLFWSLMDMYRTSNPVRTPSEQAPYREPGARGWKLRSGNTPRTVQLMHPGPHEASGVPIIHAIIDQRANIAFIHDIGGVEIGEGRMFGP